MKKRALVVLASILALTGCSSSGNSAAQSGITEEQGFSIVYDYSFCQLSAEGYTTLPQNVKSGTTVVYNVTPANGYEITSFIVNGNSIMLQNGKYSVTFTSDTVISIGIRYTGGNADSSTADSNPFGPFGPTSSSSSATPVSKEIDNEFANSLETPESYDITQHEYHLENLPVININTENGIAVDDSSLELGMNKGSNHDIMEYDYVNCNVSVSNCEDYEMEDVSGKVKIRGNYTSTYEKRPLRIKFDKKQKMCGLNNDEKFKNWVLLAEYTDGSLLKNSLTEYLGKTMLGSDGEYSTDFRFAEVYLNGSYNGLYNLVEQQEVKEGRVDIPEALDPTDNADKSEEELKDTHIGYFLEYDAYYENEPDLQNFTLNYPNDQIDYYGTVISYKQPGFTVKNDLFYQEQNDYIKETMQSIYDIVYDATNNSHNPVSEHPFYTLQDGKKVADSTIKTSREAIEKVIDVDSLLDMFFISEIAEDTDLDWSSFYMYIDMSEEGDHKLHYCAPWDYDNGFSNDSGDVFYTMKDTDTGTSTPGFGMMHNNANPWLIAFAHEDWFWALAKAKWTAHKDAGTFDNVLKMIDDYYSTYSDAYTKNAEKWTACYTSGGTVPGGAGDSCGGGGETTTVTPESKVNDVKTWTTNRIQVLNNLFDALN